MAKADISAVTKNQGGFQSPLACNSTVTTLAAGATFIGVREGNGFPHAMIIVETDQNGTLFLDFSDDGGDNWITDPIDGISVLADTPKQFIAIKGPRWFRIRFLNVSGDAQTFLRLYAYYGFFTVTGPTPDADGNIGVVVQDFIDTSTDRDNQIRDRVVDDAVRLVLECMLIELKKLNFHMELITDANIKERDLEKQNAN